MAIDVKLPNLGEGVDTGDVLEVLVKEGDTVAKDQGILEIETGKATMQVPSSAPGKIAKIHVKAGQTISPGTTLVTLEGAEAGEKPAAKKPAAPAAQPKKEQPAAAEQKKEKTEQPQEANAKRREPTAEGQAPPSKAAPAAEAPPKHEAAPVPAEPKAGP